MTSKKSPIDLEKELAAMGERLEQRRAGERARMRELMRQAEEEMERKAAEFWDSVEERELARILKFGGKKNAAS